MPAPKPTPLVDLLYAGLMLCFIGSCILMALGGVVVMLTPSGS